MNPIDQELDEHGYVQYRCPECGRVFWDDGCPMCPSCGDVEVEADDE